MLRAIAITTLLLLAVPQALAATPTCASITVGGPTPAGPYLLPTSRGLVFEAWAESNALGGLQRVACTNAAGALVAPDTRIGEVGIDTGGQPICVIRLGCF